MVPAVFVIVAVLGSSLFIFTKADENHANNAWPLGWIGALQAFCEGALLLLYYLKLC